VKTEGRTSKVEGRKSKVKKSKVECRGPWVSICKEPEVKSGRVMRPSISDNIS
jgi:hypothetical protein